MTDRLRSDLDATYENYIESGAPARWQHPSDLAGVRYRNQQAAALWRRTVGTPPQRILDVGSGSGAAGAELSSHLNPDAKLYGCDILPWRLNPGHRCVAADARNLPFAAESFDAILMFTVLSSVSSDSDRLSILAEAQRCLREGGGLIVYDMRWPNPRNDSTRPLSRRWLVRALGNAFDIASRPITVAPPIARRLPSAERLAGWKPVLSHRLAVARKR